jgi:hypothetical protein
MPTTHAFIKKFIVLAVGTAIALNAYSKSQCVDLTLGVSGLDYYSCKLRGEVEMSRISLSRITGGSEGYGFPQTVECRENLMQKAQQGFKDTRACLVKTKQTRALEALEDYYSSWLSFLKSWTEMTDTPRQYEIRNKMREVELDQKKTRLEITIQ